MIASFVSKRLTAAAATLASLSIVLIALSARDAFAQTTVVEYSENLVRKLVSSVDGSAGARAER